MSKYQLPQFDPDDNKEERTYKLRTFIEEVTRALDDLNHGLLEVDTTSGGGSTGGEHNLLTGRSESDCHPISAITALQDALDASFSGIHNDLSGRNSADAHPITSITGLRDEMDARDARVVDNTTHSTGDGSDHADVAANTAKLDLVYGLSSSILLCDLNGDGDFDNLQEAQDFAWNANDAVPGTITEILVNPGDWTVDNRGYIYEATTITADTLLNTNDGEYFEIYTTGATKYRVYMDTTGGDATQPPTSGGWTLARCDISAAADADAVAVIVAAVLDGLSAYTCPVPGAAVLICTVDINGDVDDAVNVDLGNAWDVTVSTQGVDTPYQHAWLACYVSMRSVGGSAETSMTALNPANPMLDIVGIYGASPGLDELGAGGENTSISGFTFSAFTDETLGSPQAHRFQFNDWGIGVTHHKDIVMLGGNGVWAMGAGHKTYEDFVQTHAGGGTCFRIGYAGGATLSPLSINIIGGSTERGTNGIVWDYSLSGVSLTVLRWKQAGFGVQNSLQVNVILPVTVRTTDCVFTGTLIGMETNSNAGAWISIDDSVTGDINNNGSVSLMQFQGTLLSASKITTLLSSGVTQGFYTDINTGEFYSTSDVKPYGNIPILEYGLMANG